ncbi:hypothetical protein [Aquirufa nivalisilvae]
MNQKVIVISVPFQRLIRNLLGAPILGTIQSSVEADIIIVSPFSDDIAFQKEFEGANVSFVNWNPPIKLKQPNGFLFTILEILRVNGFWRKYRKMGMEAYLVNNKMRFGVDGKDTYFSWPKRTFFSLLSWIGTSQKAWITFLNWMPKSYLYCFELDNILAKYDQVTLVQSANWGYQDHMLAWKGRNKNWKKVMIPYTVDQLFANGYLLSDYDVICVQGTNEWEYAQLLHHYPLSKITKLGSAWFTNMGYLKKKYAERLSPNEQVKNSKRQILYTGCSSQFFPASSEYEGLDYLLQAINSGELKNVEVTYRPLGETEARKVEIMEKYWNTNYLKIEFAQKACFGLAEFDSVSQELQLVEHIEQLSNADLIMMCFATSIAQDAAFLGIPSVINLVDNTGIVKGRGVHGQINDQGYVRLFEGLPIAYNYQELISMAKELLNEQELAKSQANYTVSLWHYPEEDFTQRLIEVL